MAKTFNSRVGNDGNQGKESEVKKTFTIYTYKLDNSKDKNFVAHAGFEPATFALLARRSNQLS